jgi:hypothetical protein
MGPAGPSKRRPIAAPAAALERRRLLAAGLRGPQRHGPPGDPRGALRTGGDGALPAGRTARGTREAEEARRRRRRSKRAGERTVIASRLSAFRREKTSRASATSRGWRLPGDDDKAARRQTTGPPCLGSYAVAAPANRCAKRVQRPGCRVSTSGRVGVHFAAAAGLAGSTAGVAVWQVVKKPRTARSLLLGVKRTTRFRDVRIEPRSVRVEARGLRDGARDVRDGARDVRDGARDVRDAARDVRDGARDVRDQARDVQDEARDVRDEARGVRDEARDVRGEARDVRDEARDVRDAARDVRGEARDVRDAARGVRVGARSVRARSWSRPAEGWQGTRGRRAGDDGDGHEPHHS